MKTLLLGLGAFVIWSAVQANKFIEGLTFSFANVQLDLASIRANNFTKLFLNMDLSFVNASSVSVEILGFFSTVSFQGTQLGTINEVLSFQMLANSTNTVPVDVSIDIQRSLSSAANLINSLLTANSLPLTFVGYVETNAGKIPFNTTESVPF